VEPRLDPLRTGEHAPPGLPSSWYGFDARRPLPLIERIRASGPAEKR
jgi:hypothetical protein